MEEAFNPSIDSAITSWVKEFMGSFLSKFQFRKASDWRSYVEQIMSIIYMYVQSGGDINVSNDKLLTILGIFSVECEDDNLRALIEMGADPTIQVGGYSSSSGYETIADTPLSYISRRNEMWVSDMMAEWAKRFTFTQQDLMKAYVEAKGKRNFKKKSSILLNAGLDLDKGQLIHYEVFNHNFDGVSSLLSVCKEINAPLRQENVGYYPNSAIAGFTVFEQLMWRSADTPWGKGRFQDYKIAETLIAHGAKVTAGRRLGQYLSSIGKDDSMYKLILKHFPFEVDSSLVANRLS